MVSKQKGLVLGEKPVVGILIVRLAYEMGPQPVKLLNDNPNFMIPGNFQHLRGTPVS